LFWYINVCHWLRQWHTLLSQDANRQVMIGLPRSS
jgi:hypothetical protein